MKVLVLYALLVLCYTRPIVLSMNLDDTILYNFTLVPNAYLLRLGIGGVRSFIYSFVIIFRSECRNTIFKFCICKSCLAINKSYALPFISSDLLLITVERIRVLKISDLHFDSRS